MEECLCRRKAGKSIIGNPTRLHGGAFSTDIVSQELLQRAQANRITNGANYKKWVESHTVAEIAAANNARTRLIHEFEYKTTNPKIHDERMPKRPLPAFGQFFRAKLISSGLPVQEAMKSLSSQWQSMTEADRKPYLDLAAAESVRYFKEMEKVSA